MDGSYQNNNSDSERRAVIERWMMTNIGARGFERYDDLHVDCIDSAWKEKSVWIAGGLEALQLAAGVRDQRKLDFSVALGCSLDVNSPSPIKTEQGLLAQLDWSPPSLYLFERGKEPWSRGFQSTVLYELGQRIRHSSGTNVECWYLEFARDGVNHRSIFVSA